MRDYKQGAKILKYLYNNGYKSRKACNPFVLIRKDFLRILNTRGPIMEEDFKKLEQALFETSNGELTLLYTFDDVFAVVSLTQVKKWKRVWKKEIEELTVKSYGDDYKWSEAYEKEHDL